MQTCTAFAAAQPPDRAIDLVTYPDLYDEFDNPFFRARSYAAGMPLQYDGDAARGVTHTYDRAAAGHAVEHPDRKRGRPQALVVISSPRTPPMRVLVGSVACFASCSPHRGSMRSW